jgi:hypothetical protein
MDGTMYATVLGFLFGAMPVVLVVLYAFSDAQTHQLIAIGLLPFLLVLGAAVLAGAVFASEKFVAGGGDVGGIVVSLVTIIVVTAIVLIYVTRVVVAIRPTERFVDVGTDVSSDAVTTLLKDVGAAEKDVCDLITRTDKFIQSDVGKAGHDNPALVTQAQQEARDAIGAPITDCTATGQVDVSGDAAIQEATNRIARLEVTLKSFTGPELQKTYDRTVPCQESFMNSETDVSGLQARLAAVQTEIQTQQTKLLKPMDDKNAALQRGEVSDCDKRRGAKVAVTASSTGKTPNRG